MAGAGSGLILKFGTDLNGAQKSIADFALNSVSHFAALGKMAAESGGSIEMLGKAATGLRATVVAFAAFEAAKFALHEFAEGAAAARAELEKLVKISTDAKSLGVGTTFLQQFNSSAAKAGLDSGDPQKMLEALKEASKVSLGTAGDDDSQRSAAQNAIAAHVQAGNLNKGDVGTFNAAGDQEQRLRVVLDLLTEMQNKGEKLASYDLAGKVFGSDFETKLRLDNSLVGKLQETVHQMAAGQGPNVIPPEQVEQARQMDLQLKAIQKRIEDALIPYHNDIRAMQQEELQQIIEIKEIWARSAQRGP